MNIKAYRVNSGPGPNRNRYFPSLQSAREYCAGYFQTSGIVLSIVSTADRDTFEQLQREARESRDSWQAYARELDRRYQSRDYAPAAKRRKLEVLWRAESRTWRKFYTYLEAIAPRDFGRGFPCPWLLDGLTFADAVTRDRLSVVPPLAFQWTQADQLRIIGPVSPEGEAHG